MFSKGIPVLHNAVYILLTDKRRRRLLVPFAHPIPTLRHSIHYGLRPEQLAGRYSYWMCRFFYVSLLVPGRMR